MGKQTMPLYTRQDIARLFTALKKGERSPVYFLFGERYLCQEVANDLVCQLLPEEKQRLSSLKNIDGDQEDIPATINMLKTYSLFGGGQVLRVTDSRILYSKVVAATLWEKAQKGWAAKEPRRAARFLAQMLTLADLVPADWEREELAACAPNRWQELFGFAKPEELGWVRELLTAAEDDPAPAAAEKTDAAELLQAALMAGVPAGNTLILLAEAADKRKKLFKYLEKECVVIDLSVDTGASSAARKDQEALLREIAEKTLAGFGKKLEPRALPVLLERVGFHPVAVAMESEKLALYSGEAETVTMTDLDVMVGRTREEALYEFTEAVGNHDLAAALPVLQRLREHGVYPLIVVAGLRNFLRKLLLVRAVIEQPTPPYSAGISYAAFQKGFLPRLKESMAAWPAQLNGHPFVVYKSFQQAEHFSLPVIKRALAELLQAEYLLKGSGLPDYLILENFLLSLLPAAGKTGRRQAAG
ncbi:DNA polymerase III subunit delta [Thiovibrio sp. JS02]